MAGTESGGAERAGAAEGSPARFRVALGLSVAYCGQFGTIGVFQPFFPLWLAARDLDSATIGLVLALVPAVRPAAMLAAGMLVDRSGRIEEAIRLMAAASVVAILLVAAAPDLASLFVTVALLSVVWAPSFPLLDAAALNARRRVGLDYGRTRFWGSAAYIAATGAAGAIIGSIAPTHAIWVLVACFALFATASLALVPLGRDGPLPKGAGLFAALLRPELGLIIGAAALIQSSHALLYGFASILWAGQGIGAFGIGVLWSIGVLGEIAVFLLGGTLARFARPATLVMLGGLGAVLRFSAMALDPPNWVYVPLQVLHGATFGLTHLGALGHLSAHAPPGRGAGAQLALSAGISLGMAVCTAGSGWLYEALGVRGFGVMAALGGAGAAVALLVRQAKAQPQSAGEGG